MVMFHSALLVSVVAVCVGLCSSSQDELLKNYKISRLGESTQMWCNESIQYAGAPNGSIPFSWMLPNLTILVGSSGRFIIGDDKWSLEVQNVTIDDLGQYNCILGPADQPSNSSKWYLARLGLNIQGPYFDNLWDKYEIPTIIGLSAGFGFLAIAVATVLIYQNRYQPDQEDSSSAHGSSSDDSVALDKLKGNSNKIHPQLETSELQFRNKAFDETSSQKSTDDGTTF